MHNKRKEDIAEAQKIFDWATMNLDRSVKCIVDGYKDEKYRIRFLTKENELIRGVNIPREWIKDTNPNKEEIRDELKILP